MKEFLLQIDDPEIGQVLSCPWWLKTRSILSSTWATICFQKRRPTLPQKKKRLICKTYHEDPLILPSQEHIYPGHWLCPSTMTRKSPTPNTCNSTCPFTFCPPHRARSAHRNADIFSWYGGELVGRMVLKVRFWEGERLRGEIGPSLATRELMKACEPICPTPQYTYSRHRQGSEEEAT